MDLLVDFIWKIDFRGVRWMVISYVTIFFAAIGSMIGVASLAGSSWAIATIILLPVMGVLAFISRAVTGL